MNRKKFIAQTTKMAAGFSLLGANKSLLKNNFDDQTTKNTAMNFWDIFGNSYTKNCKAWYHAKANPVIPAAGNGWKKIWTANPAYLEHNGKKLVYYRGHGFTASNATEPHDRIAVAELHSVNKESVRITDLNEGNFIIDVGAKGSFDDGAALDPTVCFFKDQFLLYYSAIGNGPDSIGWAKSTDGVHFKKMGKLMDGRAPAVIVKDGQLFLLYQKELKKGEGYLGFYVASSSDGIHFTPLSDEPVFMAGKEGEWDRQIATGRLFQQGEWTYLLYGGDNELIDQPGYFGLARSKDSKTWEKHPGNPVFGCGAKGEEDGGAMWFPALIESDNQYHLLYEGSRGKYGWDLSSQICLASLDKKKVV